MIDRVLGLGQGRTPCALLGNAIAAAMSPSGNLSIGGLVRAGPDAEVGAGAVPGFEALAGMCELERRECLRDHGLMRIEPVRPERLEEVVELWELAGLIRPWNDPRADLRRAVDGRVSVVLTGVLEGRIIATVMVGHDGHRGWVYYLAVSPDAQREGHGRAMMSAAETWLRERDVPKLNLMVRGDNEAVKGFYRSLGYADDDVVVFSRRLDVDVL